jgi:DNA cross-link repair 1A protein
MMRKQIFRCTICNNPYFDYEKGNCNQCKNVIELSNDSSNKRKSSPSIIYGVDNEEKFGSSNKKKTCIIDLVDDNSKDNDIDKNNFSSSDTAYIVSTRDNANSIIADEYENNDDLDFYYDMNNDNDNDDENDNENNNIADNKDDDDGDHCFICNLNLNFLNNDDKDSHMIECLDLYEVSQSNKVTTANNDNNDGNDDIDLRGPTFFCVICDLNLSSKGLVFRCMHLKKCAKTNNISTKELLQMISPNYDEFAPDEDDDNDKDDNHIEIDNNIHDNSLNDEKDDENCNNHNINEKSPLKNAFTLLMTSAKGDGFIKPDKITKAAGNTTAQNNTKNKYSRWNNWNNKQSTDNVYAPKYKQIKFGHMQTPIIVDGFQYGNRALSDTYFLTHFHSDHYQGLDRHFNHGTIYCSPTTASLVRLRLKVQSTCIIPLDLNKVHIIVAGGVSIKVTFLDANHCPGAVIILFEISGYKIIHTGDFRWTNKMLSSAALSDLARSPTNPKNLVVYLDTTYCDQKYNFPPQEQTILSVLDCVQNEIENDEADKTSDKKTLFVFGTYSIGKERVFMSVAANLNMKVYVEPSRYKAMMCFSDWSTQEKAILTTNPNSTNIWVVPMNKINFNSLTKLKFKRGQQCKRVVAFQPTGWTFTQSSNPEPTLHSKTSNESCNNAKVVNSDSLLVLRSNPRDNNIIYSVPYSEHSAFGELIDFIRIFKPHKIIPTVKTSVENVQLQLDLLSKYSNLQHKLIGMKAVNKSEF